MRVFLEGDKFALAVAYDPINVAKAKAIPERRWDPKGRVWLFKPMMANIEYVQKNFPQAIWSEEAQELHYRILAEQKYRDLVANKEIDLSDQLSDVPFRLPPFDHQREALILGRNQVVFAYLMEQGTGKTKVLLDDAAHNFRLGLIDFLLVICPNSVKTNWIDLEENDDEVTKHMAPDIPYVKGIWYSSMNKKQRLDWERFCSHLGDKKMLKILAVNVESLHVDRVVKVLQDFCDDTKCMIAVDESTRIKKRTAKRTKGAYSIRARAKMARIMSGTPLVKSPLDAFSQFGFLDPNILGFPTYTSFQAHFAVTGGYEGKQVLYYKNLEELSHKIAGCSYRKTKEECMDLPPKLYQKRKIEMTAEQRQHYEDMRENLITWLDEQHNVEATVILTQLLRLQQITSGYLPIINPETFEQIGEKKICKISPKIEECLDIISETSGKVVIWSRFKFDVRELGEQLSKYNIKHVLYYGEVSERERTQARQAYQRDKEIKCFAGTVTGGIGIDLFAGSTTIYPANSFSTEARLQSEDRTHRYGQDADACNYIDLVCPGTVDMRIVQVLRQNREISDLVMRDGWREWI